MSNPFENGPFWPLLFFPLTKSGRQALADIFGITAIKAGIKELKEEWSGKDLEWVNCYACGGTLAKNGRCDGCGVIFAAYIKCPICFQRQGVPDADTFSFVCARCGANVADS